MNFQELESSLEQGLRPQQPSRDLSIVIDEKLSYVKRRGRLKRRVLYAATGTAAISVALIALPTVKAHAELARMTGALDNVSQVVMTAYDILPDGRRNSTSTISYLNGNWKIADTGGRLTYFTHGVNYVLNREAGHFIAERGRSGPFGHNEVHFALSSILGEVRGKVIIDQAQFKGRLVNRATIEDQPFLGKAVIYADPETDLPLEVDEYSFSHGTWVPSGNQEFDYKTPISASTVVPDLERFPPVDKNRFEDQQVARVLSSNLGSTPLNKGRIILRSIDVGPDGTVYITCQAGERIAHWDRGYPISVSDDIGTQYAYMTFWCASDEEFIKRSQDGKLELCVFVPSTPSSEFRRKTVTVTTPLTSNNSLARHLPGMRGSRSGAITTNIWYEDASILKHNVLLATKRFEHPSTTGVPDVAKLVAPHPFDAPSELREAIAQARADYFYGTHEQDKEIEALEEAQRLHQGPKSNCRATLRLEEIREASNGSNGPRSRR